MKSKPCLTTDEFIRRSKEAHGEKYDYSKSVYTKWALKICIICPEHGEFWQTAGEHINGKGCRQCGLQKNWSNRRPTTESFIQDARKTHGDRYDYTKSVYVNSETKICITCKEHGDFWLIPRCHITGTGCDRCADIANGLKKRIGKERFIERARAIHGDKYDYSEVEYVEANKKVRILCPKHGAFMQTPAHHIGRGDGCPGCKQEHLGKSKIFSTEKFIEESRRVHGNKYDYSKSVYLKARKKITIICPEHGEFSQIASEHMYGQGCPVCGRIKSDEGRKWTLEEFIEKSTKAHNGKYDYSEAEYVSIATPIRIICPKHGPFLQKPREHMSGCGCPKCNESTLEKSVRRYLDDNNIEYVYQKKFDYLGRMSLDFYFPQYNAGLECQGIQHYEAADGYMGGGKGLKARQERDLKKYLLCKEHGVSVYYYDKTQYEIFQGKKVYKTIPSVLKAMENGEDDTPPGKV